MPAGMSDGKPSRNGGTSPSEDVLSIGPELPPQMPGTV
jgi:hypothetical protein